MALGATIYTFKIDLADSDRAVYQPLELHVARHPSETEEHLLARVFAFCLEFTEGIAFSPGISDPDQPAIAVRDLTGALRVWIDVGAPEAARLHRAAKLAPRVAVYTHKDAAQFLARIKGERIHRAAAIEFFAFDRDWLAVLASRLSRRMAFTLSVAEKNLYVSLDQETLSSELRPLTLS